MNKRHQDRWGLAFAYISFPDGLSGLIIPAIPNTFPGLEVNDGETIFEAYYSAQLTPWISLGINYQYIVPGMTEAFGNRNSDLSFLAFRSIIKL